MNNTAKVVFTKTLDKSEWDNTVLAKGDLADEITKLKKQGGKDIIAYGGANFVSALIKQGLIDEFHLFINPTAIGNGMSIFKELDSKQNFNLIKATPFECGIVVLHYEPKKLTVKDETTYEIFSQYFFKIVGRETTQKISYLL